MSAGLTYYDNRNKVESTLLNTLYTSEVIGRMGNTTYGTPIMKYTRTRTKTYFYTGLNKATAKNCVTAKQEQYTRTYYNWICVNGLWRQDKTNGMYKELVADIQASKRDGSLWDVEIQVNEVAIVYLLGESSNLNQTFTTYLGNWNYDED